MKKSIYVISKTIYNAYGEIEFPSKIAYVITSFANAMKQLDSIIEKNRELNWFSKKAILEEDRCIIRLYNEINSPIRELVFTHPTGWKTIYSLTEVELNNTSINL